MTTTCHCIPTVVTPRPKHFIPKKTYNIKSLNTVIVLDEYHFLWYTKDHLNNKENLTLQNEDN